MNLNEAFPVTEAKLIELKARIARLGIDVRLIDENFTRGGGKGGQKINKTSNAVVLHYAPMNLVVRCQRERSRSLNRFLALRELVDRVERAVSPGTSRLVREERRVRRQKDRRARRSSSKGAGDHPHGGPEQGD